MRRSRARGAGDIEKLAFGLEDLVEIGLVDDGIHARFQRQHVDIAGHHGDGLELEPLGEVHDADAGLTRRSRGTVGEIGPGQAGKFGGGMGARQLGARSHEKPDFGRRDAVNRGGA